MIMNGFVGLAIVLVGIVVSVVLTAGLVGLCIGTVVKTVRWMFD
jgi:hypothetical protein